MCGSAGTWLACAWIVAVLGWTDSARAQSPDADVEARDATIAEPPNEARGLFVRGMALAGEARWADALPLFERAYALSAEPSALYNVAATLRALGRYADTVDALEKLEADHPDLSAALQSDVHEMLVEARGRVARLIVSHTLGDADVVLRIDSRPVPVDRWPTELRVDAGPHVVDAETEGHLPFRWESTLSEGESQHLTIEFVADAPDVVVVEPPRRGWIAAVVVGLVVVGTGIALGVALSSGNDPLQHRTGTVVVDL